VAAQVALVGVSCLACECTSINTERRRRRNYAESAEKSVKFKCIS
jgi:hypothetical protein